MVAGQTNASGRLAIIAGGGLLPHYLAAAARRNGENPLIIQLLEEAAPEWSGFQVERVSVGNVAGLRQLFARHAISRVVLSGSVSRRPDWRQIRPTLGFLSRLPFVFRTLRRGGDNAVLEMVIDLLEALGCQVVGAHEIAPDLLAAPGPVGTLLPDAEAKEDMRVAIDAALQLGRLDIGQGRWPSGAGLSRSRVRRGPTRCWGASPNCAPAAAFHKDARACWSSLPNRSRMSAPICRRLVLPP